MVGQGNGSDRSPVRRLAPQGQPATALTNFLISATDRPGRAVNATTTTTLHPPARGIKSEINHRQCKKIRFNSPTRALGQPLDPQPPAQPNKQLGKSTYTNWPAASSAPGRQSSSHPPMPAKCARPTHSIAAAYTPQYRNRAKNKTQYRSAAHETPVRRKGRSPTHQPPA